MLVSEQTFDVEVFGEEKRESTGVLTLSLKKLPMLFCFNYQRLNYFV